MILLDFLIHGVKWIDFSGNLAIQYYYLGGSFWQGLFSIFGPLIFPTDHRQHSSKSRYRSIRRYIRANVYFNLMCHLSLWLVMTFLVCWGVQCIEADWNTGGKFASFVPLVIGFQVLSIALYVPFERGFIVRRKFEIISLQLFE